MTSRRTYRLFISHCWKYDDQYRSLVALLDRAPDFSWSNYSVPEDNSFDTTSARRLREGLREQIRQSQTVIVLAGMYVNHRRWIQTELSIAVRNFGKPVLGIRPRGQVRVPRIIDDTADRMVGWNTTSIVRAIREIAL